MIAKGSMTLFDSQNRSSKGSTRPLASIKVAGYESASTSVSKIL
jgi:hypothetical protein